MKKFDKIKYPSITSSNILTEEEMNHTLGGACNSSCKRGCSNSCKPGNKTIQTTPEEPIPSTPSAPNN